MIEKKIQKHKDNVNCKWLLMDLRDFNLELQKVLVCYWHFKKRVVLMKQNNVWGIAESLNDFSAGYR